MERMIKMTHGDANAKYGEHPLIGALGLVEEVVASGESLAAATALASKVGNQSPTSVAACKRLIHSARNVAIADGLAAERDEFVALFSTEDQREGTNAFLEKREPEWKNQ